MASAKSAMAEPEADLPLRSEATEEPETRTEGKEELGSSEAPEGWDWVSGTRSKRGPESEAEAEAEAEAELKAGAERGVEVEAEAEARKEAGTGTGTEAEAEAGVEEGEEGGVGEREVGGEGAGLFFFLGGARKGEGTGDGAEGGEAAPTAARG